MAKEADQYLLPYDYSCSQRYNCYFQLIVLGGVESNVSSLYAARDRILKVVQNVSDAVPDAFQNFKNGNTRRMVDVLRFEAQQLLCDLPQHRRNTFLHTKQISSCVEFCSISHYKCPEKILSKKVLMCEDFITLDKGKFNGDVQFPESF